MFEWVTVDELAESKGLPVTDATGRAWAGRSVLAVNAFIARRRPDLPAQGTDPTDPDYADVRLGAVLLAQAVLDRRATAADSADIYTYPARLMDANVSNLLGLDLPGFA